MSIMDMLGQAGGAPGGGPPAGPPPPDPSQTGGPPPGPDGGGGDPSQQDPSNLIRDMLDLLDQYKSTEEDEADKLLVEKIGTQLQQLLANNQQTLDQAMQGKISPKLLRKQYAGAPGG